MGGVHTEGSPITGDKFLRHGARAFQKIFSASLLVSKQNRLPFYSWHNHDFHINTFIKLIHLVKTSAQNKWKMPEKNKKISLKNIFPIPLYHFQSQFSIMGSEMPSCNITTLSTMCILGLSEDLIYHTT